MKTTPDKKEEMGMVTYLTILSIAFFMFTIVFAYVAHTSPNKSIYEVFGGILGFLTLIGFVISFVSAVFIVLEEKEKQCKKKG